ncbi:hypothetical protein AB0M47_26220 [Hamadaea sp. NPDC051192]|uniref:hypothetical protein n=1 Tax=Hamadaea sp. NPDC051192 TaxID=3154940 RepID=UPI003442671B
MGDFRIDLQAFAALIAALNADVAQGLAPGASRAMESLGAELVSGARSPSGEISAARAAIQDAAQMFLANVPAHLANADALLKAAEKVFSHYRETDILSQAELQRVTAASVAAGEPADESTSANAGSNLSSEFIGPLPASQIPDQIPYPGFCLNWKAYDVPRIWSMVKDEGSRAVWAQIDAYRRLADALEAQYRRMLVLRDQLSAVWTGQAAAQFLAAWDKHAAALGEDALCASRTTGALVGLAQSLTRARAKIEPIYAEWRSVTHDWTPEWWDSAAAKANDKAQLVMRQTDAAIADHRSTITVPRATPTFYEVGTPLSTDPTTDGGSTFRGKDETSQPASKPTTRLVPPVPNTNPVVDNGPELTGTPLPVAVSPSTPPSVLPIPPGVCELAPGGGAYVLPGPWVRSGRILPMPVPPTSTAFGGRTHGAAGAAGVGRGGAPNGMMVGAAGAPMSGQSGEGGRKRQRMGTEEWEVAQGVPPVIGSVEDLPQVEEAAPPEEDAFDRWFTQLASPWEAASDRWR